MDRDRGRGEYEYEKEKRERRYKGIQNVVDTFYLYDDLKDLFRRKSIREVKKIEKDNNEGESNQKQQAQEIVEEVKSKHSEKKNDTINHEFECDLKEMIERKKEIKSKIYTKKLQKDEKIFGFKLDDSNKKLNYQTFVEGLNHEEIMNKLTSIKKKHKKEAQQIHEEYKIKIKVKEYDKFSVDDLPYYNIDDDKYYFHGNFPIIECSKTIGVSICDFLKSRNPFFKFIDDDESAKNSFLINREGIKTHELLPFKKIQIENGQKEECIGVLDSQLEKRAFLLQKEKEEDLLAIRNMLFEFLEGFKFFYNSSYKGENYNFDFSNTERKKCKFGHTGKIILTFLDPSSFLKSDFEEKDLKMLKSLFDKKKKDKLKKNDEKTKNALKDAIKQAIIQSEADETKKEAIKPKKRGATTQLGYEESIKSRSLGYNPVKRLFNLNAIKIQAQEEANKKK